MIINKRGKQRLMNVVKALRDASKNEKLIRAFTMHRFGWSGNDSASYRDEHKPACGTPACALGHYAVRHDLQKKFTLSTKKNIGAWGAGRLVSKNGVTVNLNSKIAMEHFGLSEEDMFRLFSETGCARSKTPTEAADYIEKFVKEH